MTEEHPIQPIKLNGKNRNELSCKEAQAMIPGFLADSLHDRDSLRFLRHVQNCRSCYEELETNFMVERTVAFLNEDLPFDTSFDLTPFLAKRIEEKVRFLKTKKRIGIIRTVILIFTLLLIVLMLLDLTGMFHVTAFFAS